MGECQGGGGGGGCCCGRGRCGCCGSRRFGVGVGSLPTEEAVDALLADVHLLSVRFGDPIGVSLADDNVGLIRRPGGVHLEDDAEDGVAEVVEVADTGVILEGLEGDVLEAGGDLIVLLVALQVRHGPLHALGHQ